jgi:DnaJ-class molecular chaperone
MGPKYKDYYGILGVTKSATDKEIKAAYRKLARKYHPDVNPGVKSAEEKFKEISEAHDVLEDPEKRRQYDQYGDQWKSYSQGGQSAPFSGFGGQRTDLGGGFQGDLSGLFSTLFGDMSGGRSGNSSNRVKIDWNDFEQSGGGAPQSQQAFGGGQQPQATKNIETTFTISLEDAFSGGTRGVNLSLPNGRYDLDNPRASVTQKQIDVKIPAGIAEGQKIRLAGQAPNGADVLLIIKIAPHAQFERRGNDLITDVPVSYLTAVLGGEMTVPTLSGPKMTVRLPGGTSSGAMLRLGGHGMPELKGGGKGDLLARVKITVPKQLTERQRQLFEELARLEESK